MRTPIAIALCLGLALSVGACGKDKDKNPAPRSGLERPPGELPRPSEGLPDDLKPPRE